METVTSLYTIKSGVEIDASRATLKSDEITAAPVKHPNNWVDVIRHPYDSYRYLPHIGRPISRRLVKYSLWRIGSAKVKIYT